MVKGKILVTGADGFIGSHLTEALVRQGYDVRAFVLYNSFNSWGWLDHCSEDVKGKSPYSASKIGADQIAMSFYTSFGTPVSIIRPFNTYGPRQSAKAVIPTIITQIANGKRQIKLGAVSPTRDFNYVADMAGGFLAALNVDQGVGEVINLGSNFEISIGDTVRTIAEVMGVEIEILTDEQRLRPEKSEVERLWASNDKAHRLLGWQPQYGRLDGFRRGLEETVAWFSKPANLASYKSATPSAQRHTWL